MWPQSLVLPRGSALDFYVHECIVNVVNATVTVFQHEHALNMNLCYWGLMRWSKRWWDQMGKQIERSSLKCFVTGFVMNTLDTTAHYPERWRKEGSVYSTECRNVCVGVVKKNNKKDTQMSNMVINVCTCFNCEQKITKLCMMAVISVH